ncbi:AAA family ATPase [Kitasatospora sp. NPDC059088]|uniref:AAA family ATPase n=1 Tax=Kitasatospora sp. NPDC059088 TaxID=3346722 RepID=UPI003678C64D
MYLKNVRVRNVRGFRGVREVDLDLTRPDGSYAGWTVLAGRNGSGKSTLLRAVALAVSGPSAARGLVTGFDSWISDGRPLAVAEVCLAHDPSEDRFTTGRPPAGAFWAGLEWTVPDDVTTTAVRHAQPAMSQVKYRKAPTAAQRGPWADNPVGWFCAGYGPFRRLVGGSGEVQRRMAGSGPVARLTSLFHEDASLAEGVSWLIEQHLRSLENRPGAAELKRTALEILGDDLLPDDYTIGDVDSDGLWVAHDGRSFALREMSDGYRTVAALVVDILKQLHDTYGALRVERDSGHPVVTVPGVVIIDEIDAHLHVSWQKRIGGWLKEHFPLVQFLVTTHSPYICQAADPAGLIRLPGPDVDEAPEVVGSDLYDRVVYGSGDDAVLSELFGLDTPYSQRADEARALLVALELRIVAGEADDQDRERYRQLKRTLTSSPSARVDEVAARLRSLTGRAS